MSESLACFVPNTEVKLRRAESMKKVIYVHGKGGNAAEAEHFRKLFADCEVVGFDYKSQSPREARDEFLPFSLTKKQPLAQ